MDEGRRRHYGTFYGVRPLPGDGRPILVVHGNCQAEAVRVLLAGQPQETDGGSTAGTFATVRIPPVHELFAEDLPFLTRLLAHTEVLVSQPVRDRYRDLPLGTAQLASALPAGARVLRYPIVRYLGLHPYQAIVRHPDAPSAVPDLVPYHDLRLLAARRDRLSRAAAIERVDAVDAAPAALRAVAETSLAELVRREKDCDIGISEVIETLAGDPMHTVNHPGNPLLIALARRIEQALGVPAAAADPGRDLLGGVRAPVDHAVRSALGRPGPTGSDWLVGGTPVSPSELVEAHWAWYDAHPAFVGAGLDRHAERLAVLGL